MYQRAINFIFSPNTKYWVKTLSKFLSIQFLVQILGFVSGLLIIRTLSKEDYAYLTIANSMQGTMNILADSGVSVGLSAIGGKVWQDRNRFGQLINTSMALRRWFGLIVVVVITPIMIWMLINNQAPISYIILITGAILIELYFYLEIAVLGTIPRMHSQVSLIQNLDLVAAASRLILLSIAYLSYLNAVVAAFASMIASGLQSFFLKRSVLDKVDNNAQVNNDDRKYVFNVVKNLLPGAIFYSIQGQLTVVFISVFGNTQQIAEIGALGRLAILFTLINSVMSSVVLPSFARCQSVSLLRKRYIQIVFVFLGLGLALLSLATMFPKQILSILGNNYSNLERELVWMIASTVVASIGGVMWSLCSVKGWVEKAWIEIPVRISLQIILLIVLDISTVRGVLIFTLISSLSPIVIATWLADRGLKTKAVQV